MSLRNVSINEVVDPDRGVIVTDGTDEFAAVHRPKTRVNWKGEPITTVFRADPDAAKRAAELLEASRRRAEEKRQQILDAEAARSQAAVDSKDEEIATLKARLAALEERLDGPSG